MLLFKIRVLYSHHRDARYQTELWQYRYALHSYNLQKQHYREFPDIVSESSDSIIVSTISIPTNEIKTS